MQVPFGYCDQVTLLAWWKPVPQFCLILMITLILGCGASEPPAIYPASPAPSPEPTLNALDDVKLGDVGETSQEPPQAEIAATESNLSIPAPAESPAAQVAPVQAPRIAAPTEDQIAKWTVPDYQPMQLLECYDGFDDPVIQSMAIAPDGSRFAIGGAKLTVWKTGETKPAIELTGASKDTFTPPMRAIAISPDGKWLSGGDQKGMVWILDMSDFQKVVTIKAHSSYVATLAFSPDSQQLATTSYSGEVSFWTVADGTLIKKAKVTTEKIAKMFYLTQDRLAVTGGDVSVWDVKNDQQEVLLAPRYVGATGLAISHDGRRFFYCDKEDVAHTRAIETASDDVVLPRSAHSAMHAAYSHDGKWLATANTDATVRIIDTESGRLCQVIDTDVNATAAIGWVPKTSSLLVASERGRVRLWGRSSDATALAIKPIQLPEVKEIQAESTSPASVEQLSRVFDLRTLPRLPDAVASLSHFAMDSYTTAATRQDAEAFYRYTLGKEGWTELPSSNPQYLINFSKQGCLLNVSFYESSMPAEGTLSVNLSSPGNYDARWLPKLASIEQDNSYGFFASSSYRTKEDLSAIEASLIKLFHDQGWTGYTRLAASSNEQPNLRFINLLQGGIELTVMIGRAADQPDRWSIQTSVNVQKKTLPIPPDSGWVEFDSSSELMMVANTKMTLLQTIEFYDQQMAAEGWLMREAGRTVNTKEGRAWLPYIRGQYDVMIALQPSSDESTRIIAGNPGEFSWQLKKVPEVDTDSAKTGIEVADWPFPKGASDVDYKVDEKQLFFNLVGVKPLELLEQYSKQLTGLGWEQDPSGVTSDEYVLVTFKKGAAELDMRIRLSDDKDSSVSIDGSGLLWSKPLPVPPVPVSFGTWLMRHRYAASLDRLDEFAAEMKELGEKK